MWKYLRVFNPIIYPEGFYKLSSKIVPIVTVLLLATVTYGLYGALISSPADYQQGESVRIMYIHVPSAMLSLSIFSFMAFCSVCYLIWRIKLYDIFAAAAAPVGAVYTLIALVTGSLWGKPTWGTWWIWDARLTSELVLFFIYLAYILLRQSIPNKKAAAKACALLAIVGLVDIPIIHFSVEWWHTLHQGSSIEFFSASSKIAPQMLGPLLTMLVAFGLCFLWVFMVKSRTLILEEFSQQQWVKSVALR